MGTSVHEASIGLNWYVTYDIDLFSKAHYRSEVRGELGNHDLSDPYTTLDLGLSYNAITELDFKFGVNNLFNKDISSPDTYTEVIKGRTYYAGLNYVF
nr:TonB-dependent receptor [Vibrio splendidus]